MPKKKETRSASYESEDDSNIECKKKAIFGISSRSKELMKNKKQTYSHRKSKRTAWRRIRDTRKSNASLVTLNGDHTYSISVDQNNDSFGIIPSAESSIAPNNVQIESESIRFEGNSNVNNQYDNANTPDYDDRQNFVKESICNLEDSDVNNQDQSMPPFDDTDFADNSVSSIVYEEIIIEICSDDQNEHCNQDDCHYIYENEKMVFESYNVNDSLHLPGIDCDQNIVSNQKAYAHLEGLKQTNNQGKHITSEDNLFQADVHRFLPKNNVCLKQNDCYNAESSGDKNEVCSNHSDNMINNNDQVCFTDDDIASISDGENSINNHSEHSYSDSSLCLTEDDDYTDDIENYGTCQSDDDVDLEGSIQTDNQGERSSSENVVSKRNNFSEEETSSVHVTEDKDSDPFKFGELRKNFEDLFKYDKELFGNGEREIEIEENYRIIVDHEYVHEEQKKAFCDHAAKNNCSYIDWMYFQNKNRRDGLLTKLCYGCQKCNFQTYVWSECLKDVNHMDLNDASTASSLCAGMGYQQTKEFLAGLNIYVFCDKTYKAHQDRFYIELDKAAHDIMRINGERSKNRAIEKGKVTESGDPYITACGDASYPVRSYGNNYKSPAGTVSVFDVESGDILFVIIYNSECYTCKKPNPPDHRCYKNLDRKTPITAIEAAGMLEACKKSVPDHGIIFETLVTDEDSSIYNTLRQHNVYRERKVQINRKLCTNHLRKNFQKKLRAATKTTQPRGQPRIQGFVKMRDLITHKNKDIVARVEELIQKRLSENLPWDQKVKELQSDILNVASHVFGEHKQCQERGDECTPNLTKNDVEGLKAVGLYHKITDALTHLAQHSDSLLFGATTNRAEQFHSLICHLIAGKRVNQCLTNLYPIKVYVAVLNHSTQASLMTLYTYMNKNIPRILVNVTQQRIRKNAQTKERRAAHGRKKRRFRKDGGKYYGSSHQEADMSEQQFEEQKKIFLSELEDQQRKRQQIERDTTGQYKCPLWQTTKRDLLTSSNFRTACQWSIKTSCANRIKRIIYPPVEDNELLSYGRQQKEVCKQKLSELFAEEVRPCGLFIDTEHKMLGCTPDALLGETSLVAIKCPYLAVGMTAEDAIEKDPGTRKMFNPKDIKKINKNHDLYYQIQGQLHILKLDHAWLVIHTPLSRVKFRIDVDQVFWTKRMEQQLLRFYNDCMLPELINSRYNRKMPIRNPQYTLDILEQKKQNKNCQNAQKESKQFSKNVTTGTTASFEFVPKEIEEDEDDFLDDATLSKHASLESIPEEILTDVLLHDGSIDNIENLPVGIVQEIIEMQKNMWDACKKENSKNVKQNPKEPRKERVEFIEIVRDNLKNPNRNAMSDEQIRKFRDIYDHREISPAQVQPNVLSPNWLDENSIDLFIRVLEWSNPGLVTQSVLYQYSGADRAIEPIRDEISIQIIGGTCANHWRCLYFDKERIRIYDSLYWGKPGVRLSEIEQRYVTLRFPSVKRRHITFEPLLITQKDGSCGVFAAAFAVTLSRGGNPSEVLYSIDGEHIRQHFMDIINEGQIVPFPTQ